MVPITNINYDQRLLEGESQTLEFKTSFDKTTVESLVAFANAQGGRALLTFTQSGGVSGGVNEGVNMLLAVIHNQTELRAPALAQTLQTSPKNIERWLKQLKDSQLIEFRGAPKTGGYYPKSQW